MVWVVQNIENGRPSRCAARTDVVLCASNCHERNTVGFLLPDADGSHAPNGYTWISRGCVCRDDVRCTWGTVCRSFFSCEDTPSNSAHRGCVVVVIIAHGAITNCANNAAATAISRFVGRPLANLPSRRSSRFAAWLRNKLCSDLRWLCHSTWVLRRNQTTCYFVLGEGEQRHWSAFVLLHRCLILWCHDHEPS